MIFASIPSVSDSTRVAFIHKPRRPLCTPTAAGQKAVGPLGPTTRRSLDEQAGALPLRRFNHSVTFLLVGGFEFGEDLRQYSVCAIRPRGPHPKSPGENAALVVCDGTVLQCRTLPELVMA
jgi:hypothetical protein